MKIWGFVLFVLISGVAYAVQPSTTCPAGYVAVIQDDIILAETTCPAGYVAVGTATSCLVELPDSTCIMYAPHEILYDDDSGDYRYTPFCPLTQ